MPIPISEKAPDFTLQDQNSKNVSLSSLLDKRLVLFFYPKDFTPGCTKEACDFRDASHLILELGANVVGISSDSPEKHREFEMAYKLNYPLLSDSKGVVRKAYKVSQTLGLLPGRATYIIDTDRSILFHFASQLGTAKHISEVIKFLKTS